MLTEMARNRKRKTNRETVPSARMKEAVLEVVEKKRSIKSVSSFYDIKRTTLRRYIIKYRQADDKDIVSFVPKYNARQVLSEEQELMLVDYLLSAAKYNYGHSPMMARRLAYEFALANDVNLPYTWLRDCAAGEEWMTGFLRRHKSSLSIRTPEATSLGRGSAFNLHNVQKFFDNLDTVYKRHQYGPEVIFNCDETALTTVQRPVKVIAGKGIKQVRAVTSQEKGQLVTACCTINALGNSIPPFMVYPRVHFKNHMIAGSPAGTAGTAHPSGWMTSDCFIVYLKHFIYHSKSSKSQPVLLILDNHESHISIEGLDLCKANGVTLLTLPPHCSHEMQPLDVSVYGPLKKYYSDACTGWMHSNPGIVMTIYNISQCFGEAYPSAFCPKNIQSGFRSTGIWPFNRNIFVSDRFAGAHVTDRLPPSEPATEGMPLTACRFCSFLY